MNCPCGSLNTYEKCCYHFHKGEAFAETALRLMKSRYSAFVKGGVSYLKRTTLPHSGITYGKETLEWIDTADWIGLYIRHYQNDLVEFVAFYSIDQQHQYHHETSLFKKIKDQWYYASGTVHEEGTYLNSIERNEPCFCGSMQKFKKCCG